jgi:hypothetical protein
VTQIEAAVATVGISIERLLFISPAEVASEVPLTDAMRVSVVGKNGVIVSEPVLHFHESPLILRVGAIVGLEDVRVKRPINGILQI